MSTWFRTYGFAEILPELLIGAYPLDGEDVAMLNWIGVRRVLNLVADEEYRPGEREAVENAYAKAGIEEYRLDFVDHAELPGERLEAAVQEVLSWLETGVRSYVHCRAGWQRSAAVAVGLVALSQRLDIDAALELVQARKPSAVPLPHQREDLWRWWEARGGTTHGDQRSDPLEGS
jgi:protein-tyrosine phosphatase